MSPAGPHPQSRPADPQAAHTEPPRAVLLTGCPLLAAHAQALDARVHAAVIHRLPGSAEPALPDTDGLLLLLGPADARTAASTGLTTITHTLYLATNPHDTAVWQRATALRAHTVLVLPDGERQLQAEVTSQLGADPTRSRPRTRSARHRPKPRPQPCRADVTPAGPAHIPRSPRP